MPEERKPEIPRRGSTERYPGNSHVEKAENAQKLQKMELQGGVQIKPPLSRRIRESIMGDDAQTIGSYILFEVIIPAFKDLVVDTGKEALERAFFPSGGGPRSRGRSSGSSFSGGSFGQRQPYRSGARNDVPFDREDRRPLSPRARDQYKFDEIILETRGDAEVALDSMREAIDVFGQVSVAEVLDMLGQGNDANYVMRDWGWTDLRGAGVRRQASDAWLLDLPDAKRFPR